LWFFFFFFFLTKTSGPGRNCLFAVTGRAKPKALVDGEANGRMERFAVQSDVE
jgi:hypothetical protein